MRTTVTLADDVAAAVEARMRRDHVGRSDAVNALVRAGLRQPREQPRYEHRSYPLGIKVDVTCTGALIDLLDKLDAEEAEARRAG